MEKCMPRNGKEGLIYGGVICALTCMFMATMNICISMGGVSRESIVIALKSFPVVFIIAMILEGLIVGKIAKFVLWLVAKNNLVGVKHTFLFIEGITN